MNGLTKFSGIILAVVLTAAALMSSSCIKDSREPGWNYYIPTALVTVKPLDDAGTAFYMQLNDETTLMATNMTKSPYGGKEVRAFVNYDRTNMSAGDYDQAVSVNWIDSIRTKNLAPRADDLSAEYGNDPVEILGSWCTVVEDGYLSLNFVTLSGGYGARHDVNLIYVGDPTATADSEKYVLEFKHNANGDNYGRYVDGYVAFWLGDAEGIEGMPDTGGKTVRMTLRWDSYSGRKSTVFDYCSRPTSDLGSDGDAGTGDGSGSDGDAGTGDGTEGNSGSDNIASAGGGTSTLIVNSLSLR